MKTQPITNTPDQVASEREKYVGLLAKYADRGDVIQILTEALEQYEDVSLSKVAGFDGGLNEEIINEEFVARDALLKAKEITP